MRDFLKIKLPADVGQGGEWPTTTKPRQVHQGVIPNSLPSLELVQRCVKFPIAIQETYSSATVRLLILFCRVVFLPLQERKKIHEP